MLVSHNWLKDYIGDSIPTAKEIAELLETHAFEIDGIEKVGDEEVIDVDVLPNRASDCLCHRGIAREIATLTSTPLSNDPLTTEPENPTTDKITVDIADENACRRFGIALLTGIKIKESPKWLINRLEALGQRSINNVVDATNYVMLSIGQPIHAYDAGKFPQSDGIWKFGVRMAQEGEKITILGGNECELTPDIQLIVDASNDAPAGIAGIKGGTYAEIDENTTTVILEAANFDPTLTRKAAQKLRLPTDASKRFENAPAEDLIPYALSLCTKLVTDIVGGTIEGYVDKKVSPQVSPVTTYVSLEQINSHLGIQLDTKVVTGIFERLGIEVKEDNGIFSVHGPWERTDLNIPEDYIEEVGRVYGYAHIEAVVPETVPLAEINKRHYYSEKIRNILIELGFSEVITSSFRKKDKVQLLNALAEDKSYMRSTLLENISEVLDMNASHADLLGTADTRVFEIGTVFTKEEDNVDEHVSLCIGVRIKSSGYSGKEDKVLKDTVEKIGEGISTTVDWSTEKGVSEINLTELLKELHAPISYETVEVTEELQYKPYSVYPAISRDIAMWVSKDTTSEMIEEVLNKEAGELRVRTTLFDEFEKEDKKSYAFRLVFQSMEKTLTDEEVNEIMDKVYKVVTEKGWTVR